MHTDLDDVLIEVLVKCRSETRLNLVHSIWYQSIGYGIREVYDYVGRKIGDGTLTRVSNPFGGQLPHYML